MTIGTHYFSGNLVFVPLAIWTKKTQNFKEISLLLNCDSNKEQDPFIAVLRAVYSGHCKLPHSCFEKDATEFIPNEKKDKLLDQSIKARSLTCRASKKCKRPTLFEKNLTWL